MSTTTATRPRFKTAAEVDSAIDRYIALALKAEERREAAEHESPQYWRHHDTAVAWHERARRLMPRGS